MIRKLALPLVGLVVALAVLVALRSALPTATDARVEATPAPTVAWVELQAASSARDDGRQKGDPMAAGRSYAGTVAAPEFPAGLDWLNTATPLTLAQLRGKVVVLDFWTYGCINCMHVIPDLKRLEEEFADELVVIGVHSAKFANEGDTDNIRQIILRYGLEHPVINDRDFTVWRTWGARAWPTLVIIDPAGKVVGGHSGEQVYPLFRPVIASLVAEFDAQGLIDRTPIRFKLERDGLPATVLSFPGKVLADPAGSRLFIADTGHNRIVVADLRTGAVLDVIGHGDAGYVDGDYRSARFNSPQGMAFSAEAQMLFVADTGNHTIRQVDLSTQLVHTLAGMGYQARTYPPKGGRAPDVELNSPWDLALDRNILYIAMAGSHQLWQLNLNNRETGPFAGSGREGTKDGLLGEAELAQPSGLALDGMGRLYFADAEGSSIRWAETDSETGRVGTLAGSGQSLFDFGDVDGIGNVARLQHPLAVAIHDSMVYVADTYNGKIKRIDPATRQVTTWLGGGHGWRDGAHPLFYEPGGLAVANGKLYVADTNNHAIRIVDLATNTVSTLVLTGIEKFMDMGDDFPGTVAHYEPVTVAAGPGRIVLDMQLPAGYKVNTLAPSSMQWRVDGGVATLSDDAGGQLAAPAFPLTIDAVFQPGEGTLTGDISLYYCEAEKESLCLLEVARLVVPVRVADGAGHDLSLTYRVALPDLSN